MADEYTRPIEEREEQFKIFDKIKSKVPYIAPEKIEKDVRKAIQAIRKKRV